MDKKRRLRKKKEGQERSKSVDRLADSLVDEAEQRLKAELSLLGSRAKEAGFLINTGKLWRQSAFQPPDKYCSAIKERHSSFLEWKEAAVRLARARPRCTRACSLAPRTHLLCSLSAMRPRALREAAVLGPLFPFLFSFL
jgi:hypothetical protein